MDDNAKQRITLLFEELFNTTLSESRQIKINLEINKLSPDPAWSDYIFYSDDYVNEDGSINYDKFFEKISDYPNSYEYITKSRILELVERLVARDFSEIDEIEIVNEINSLSPDVSWMDYIFADETCIYTDGNINKVKFLNKIFDEDSNENFR